MTDRQEALSGGRVVEVLSWAQWTARVARGRPPTPFAAPRWLRMGLTARPGLRFMPLAVPVNGPEADGEVLLPVCVPAASDTAQIGCFGYGTPCPGGSWPGAPLHLPRLAEQVHAVAGVSHLVTLLPPPGVAPGLDRLTGHWAAQPGRPTYLLDLGADPARVWHAAKGSVRTAVRRARDHGLRALPPSPDDGPALLRLYRHTMGRNGAPCLHGTADFTALCAVPDAVPPRPHDVVTALVGDDDGPQAAAVFAVAEPAAYHILQVTSEAGRRTNAGHLALWCALESLAERGVRTVDLGSAAAPGQVRFKTSWSPVPAMTRLVRWPHGPEGDP
ncbi:GNAT family N-acetyltransferase [Streptomyces sp. NPDC057743]|uniref:GNAT family N-acetyltransferase n=1 Tax=Streptomyces sp. NPDC057743 TaxID=3346236 RepID=UPI0036760B4E